ncbi:MAG TPA: hypothetical protein VFT16_05425 [Candidatus Saccharimonadales bacterium]|nr:hypothetical protein [Candidatus Saccharimonadales bacterium]
MKRLRLILASLGLALVVLAPASHVMAAGTDPFKGACESKGSSSSAACQANGSDPLTGENGLLIKVTRIISFLAGVCSVILIVTAGLMYVMSDGDSSKVHSAKTTLVYAVVGLVIVGVAQGIIILVLNML